MYDQFFLSGTQHNATLLKLIKTTPNWWLKDSKDGSFREGILHIKKQNTHSPSRDPRGLGGGLCLQHQRLKFYRFGFRSRGVGWIYHMDSTRVPWINGGRKLLVSLHRWDRYHIKSPQWAVSDSDSDQIYIYIYHLYTTYMPHISYSPCLRLGVICYLPHPTTFCGVPSNNPLIGYELWTKTSGRK